VKVPPPKAEVKVKPVLPKAKAQREVLSRVKVKGLGDAGAGEGGEAEGKCYIVNIDIIRIIGRIEDAQLASGIDLGLILGQLPVSI
jgi:hypothetical protein